MTETGSGCVYEGYPLRGVELRAADNGEIEIKAPLLLRAYRTIAGEQNPVSADGWFGTGDLGRIDDDGRLWIDGRAGDMNYHRWGKTCGRTASNECSKTTTQSPKLPSSAALTPSGDTEWWPW